MPVPLSPSASVYGAGADPEAQRRSTAASAPGLPPESQYPWSEGERRGFIKEGLGPKGLPGGHYGDLSWYAAQADKVPSLSRQNIDAARQAWQQSRGVSQDALGQMRQQALAPTLAGDRAQMAREAAQLAVSRGMANAGDDLVAAGNVMTAGAGQMGQIGDRALEAGARERIAREQAYAQAAAGTRQADLARMVQEGQLTAGQAAALMAKERYRQDMLRLGLAHRQRAQDLTLKEYLAHLQQNPDAWQMMKPYIAGTVGAASSVMTAGANKGLGG